MRNKIVLIISVLFLSIIPPVHIYLQNTTSWAGVVPSFVNDDLYYYARMQNIMHGYPFIGNPYFFEHRNELSPAFFASDWLAVIPLLFGIPFVSAVAFNFIIWSIIFSLLVYFLFRQYGMSKSVSVVWSLLSYAAMYILILRPVSMQIVAPFFLFFCISYGIWLKAKIHTRKQDIFLIIAIAASFYVYTYLWQVVAVVCGLSALFLLYRKQWLKFKNLILIGIAGGILALPAILYTWKQISSPYYWESMARIGLVNTHLPTALSVYDSGMIISLLLLWALFFIWLPSLKDDGEYKNAFSFVSIIGISLIVVLFSNVITGKELEISNHIERFVTIWISIALLLHVWFVMKYKSEVYAVRWYKRGSIAFLFALSSAVFLHFLISDFAVRDILQTDVVSPQVYADTLNWLNSNAPKESVIWSNGGIGFYMPIFTSNFQLFNAAGGLHLMSSKELEERYLVSHYFDNLEFSDIERDFREYAGVGNSIHQYKTFNRKVKICKLLHLSVLGVDCGQETDAVSFKGEKYFADLYNQYKNTIQPNILGELKKFNVTYIVKDNESGNAFAPEKISHTRLLWENSRFKIYRLY